MPRNATSGTARIGLALALILLLRPAPPVTAAPPFIARVTWYERTGDVMFSGDHPYPGAAACSSVLPLGTVVRLYGKDGRELTVTCWDRGQIDHELWLDIFCEDEDCGRFVARNFSPYAYALVTLPR